LHADFLAHMIYGSIKFLNHIDTIHIPSMILKRAKPSSIDACTRGLNTHEGRF